MNWVAQALSAVASVSNPVSLRSTYANYVSGSYCNQPAHLLQNAFKTSEREKCRKREGEGAKRKHRWNISLENNECEFLASSFAFPHRRTSPANTHRRRHRHCKIYSFIQRTLICRRVLIHFCAPINAFNVARMKMIRLNFHSFRSCPRIVPRREKNNRNKIIFCITFFQGKTKTSNAPKNESECNQVNANHISNKEFRTKEASNSERISFYQNENYFPKKNELQIL